MCLSHFCVLSKFALNYRAKESHLFFHTGTNLPLLEYTQSLKSRALPSSKTSWLRSGAMFAGQAFPEKLLAALSPRPRYSCKPSKIRRPLPSPKSASRAFDYALLKVDGISRAHRLLTSRSAASFLINVFSFSP